MAIFGWGVTDRRRHRPAELRGGVASCRRSRSRSSATARPSTPDTSGDGATGRVGARHAGVDRHGAQRARRETLYFGHHNTDADILAAITAWVNDRKGPMQASASFGECENVPATSGAIGVDGIGGPGDTMLEQAVIEGRTLFSSTGDTGSSCPIVPVEHERRRDPGVSRPRMAVGQPVRGRRRRHRPEQRRRQPGAALLRDRLGVHRRRQLDERAGRQLSAGRRPDEMRHRPERQSVRPRVAAGPLCRSTPDVAAISGDVATGNGMLITNDNGADQQGAGTSLSSPLWLGMWTRIQAAARQRRVSGSRTTRSTGSRKASPRATSTTSRSATTSRTREARLGQRDRLGDARRWRS